MNRYRRGACRNLNLEISNVTKNQITIQVVHCLIEGCFTPLSLKS